MGRLEMQDSIFFFLIKLVNDSMKKKKSVVRWQKKSWVLGFNNQFTIFYGVYEETIIEFKP